MTHPVQSHAQLESISIDQLLHWLAFGYLLVSPFSTPYSLLTHDSARLRRFRIPTTPTVPMFFAFSTLPYQTGLPLISVVYVESYQAYLAL